jgi:hypothetical protein
VTVADINGDNKGDIIVANSGSNSVSVLLNTGNGTFIAQTTYSTDSSPYFVAAADVNNDSKTDIIVANNGANNFGILLNTGNGTFTAQTTYSTGSSPSCVAVADVNNDDKPDIIVANAGSNNVGVFLQIEGIRLALSKGDIRSPITHQEATNLSRPRSIFILASLTRSTECHTLS